MGSIGTSRPYIALRVHMLIRDPLRGDVIRVCQGSIRVFL